MPTLTNWPITRDEVRKAIRFKPTDQVDETELDLWAEFVCELVDSVTGRDLDPERHVLTSETDDGVTYRVPTAFVMAARVTAYLLWRQEKNGGTGEQGIPMGAEMPAKAKAWLARYPAEPGIGG